MDLRSIRQRFEQEAAELRRKMFDASRVDVDALHKAFVELPGQIAYWTARTAIAHGVLLRVQAEKVRKRALLELQHRADLERERGMGSRNVPNDLVAANVELDEDWLDIVDDEITARVSYEEHKGTMSALDAKRDMLVQLGAHERIEMNRDPVVLERHRARNVVNGEGDSNG